MNRLIKGLNKFNFLRNNNNLNSNKFYFCRNLCSNTNDLIDRELIKDQRVFQDLNVKQFESLAKNEDQMKKIELILSEYEYNKYSTLEVPTNITNKQMSQLLELNSSEQRIEFLSFWYRNELRKIFQKEMKEIQKPLKRQQLADKWKDSTQTNGVFDEKGDIIYGLWHNTIFTRIRHKHINRYSLHRLRTAAQFGQNIVFDLRCDPSMKLLECQSKLNQLFLTYCKNRKFSEAFNLHFCNFDKNGVLSQTLQKSNIYSKFPYFVSEFTDKSYIDLFDKNNLVYLSPIAEKDFEFDMNKVYIISLSNGSTNNYNSILCRKEGIDIRKLPLDSYVYWGSHQTKDLKSFTVLSILNDIREGLHWKEAIERNVSKNCLKTEEMLAEEDTHRLNKFIKQRETLGKM